MDTTPEAESSEPGTGTDAHRAELDELAAVDPADAPDAAERLAADLAGDLEGIGSDGEPTQLTAPFTGDAEEPS